MVACLRGKEMEEGRMLACLFLVCLLFVCLTSLVMAICFDEAVYFVEGGGWFY